MKSSKHMYLILFWLLASIALPARSELTIEITQGADSAVPIAVVPFRNNSVRAIPEDISKIISDDLMRSGEFEPVPIGRMLSMPSRANEVFYREWRLLGQNYLVIGEIDFSSAQNKYNVRYELFDVNQQQRIDGQLFSSTENNLRALAHRISDAIYEKIIGIKGLFSTKIAYITLQKGSSGALEYRLQTADADGHNAKVLLNTSKPVLSPSWSPDAKQMAYVSFETGRPAIYIQDIASGAREIVSSFKGLNGAPAFSPDGKKLALTLSKDGNAEIYVMDLASRSLDRLTRHFAIDTEPSWSVDGRSIVFTSDRSGKPQVYRMNVNGGTPERLTFEGKYNARPRFSSDGKRIFYVHQRNGEFNIAALDLESGESRVLTQTPLDESPSIAPNGRMLIYGTQRGKSGVLAVVSVDGSTKYFLPSKFGDVREPAWSPFTR
ncbi:MAG: Tol-Pal system beta propeller repeat protein TolB [Pseudomonadales bacterium]|uniref:Tol-Pal system protein TolB n=1 Tax=Oleiphilus messinensis TaxID=141451 RepID=A0A1Y0I7Y3_9GAMM|nr:Tol-Pal system beta propeller repeat protein TolB [Oleiphilus messinensis]ARU56612.1 translocation protein TolB [Oleiphilus messinensis]MCG8611727.1 Tol-Pal system beta propeller repeat protein TolB [Pseudomonadales bacterium]